ncbi:tRNA adenosine deaminase-associated protein [Streptomyces sp. NPDC002537]
MYFAALLARTEDGWQASDTELDNVETLSDLADLARESSVDDDTVLVLIEQEDAWFGVVRVDGEEDPRVYLSNAAAASRNAYGSLLADELLGRDRTESDLASLPDLDGTEDGEPEPDDDEADAPDSALPAPAGPLGDQLILDDYGVGKQELLAFDSDALSGIAEALGCTEVLEAVR